MSNAKGNAVGTAEQVCRIISDCKHAFDHAILLSRESNQELLDILREYAAHLAAQAEWPSEEGVERAAKAHYVSLTGDGADYEDGNADADTDRMQKELYEAMRAALQSVRPPVGVVSEPEWIGSLRNELMQSKSTHSFTFTRDEVMALLASRHAPTKD